MTKNQADLLTYWLITEGDAMLSFYGLHNLKVELYPTYGARMDRMHQDITNGTLGANGLIVGEQGLFSITDKAKQLLQEMANEQRIDSGTADK